MFLCLNFSCLAIKYEFYFTGLSLLIIANISKIISLRMRNLKNNLFKRISLILVNVTHIL